MLQQEQVFDRFRILPYVKRELVVPGLAKAITSKLRAVALET